MVHCKKLNNGIRLIVKQMNGLMSVSMGILVRTGASVESDSEDGISHFIEHMMFKGTKKRSAFAISDEMDRIGAQMNAFTSKDITCYYAKSTTGHAEE
ncbi:MAG: insulinase family protein, partial [Clostridia bacterium]|nr:insulinase family protein [Clostridia bacterium]